MYSADGKNMKRYRDADESDNITNASPPESIKMEVEENFVEKTTDKELEEDELN